MMSKTHFAFGLLVGLFFADILGIEDKLLFVSICVLASLLPDIDLPMSKVGSKVRPLSWLLNLFFGHRGLIHTIFIPFIIWWILSHYGWNLIAAAFFLGYMSHLIIDMLNTKGICFFYPLSKVRVNGFVKAGGLLEWVLFLAIIFGIVLILV
jgi:inner membrane protein